MAKRKGTTKFICIVSAKEHTSRSLHVGGGEETSASTKHLCQIYFRVDEGKTTRTTKMS